MTRTRRAPDLPPIQCRTAKGTGRLTLAGVDGRSNMARRFREITAEIENDLGGDLTEAQRHLVARAATLGIWCEERETELAKGQDFDALQYSTVSNAMRRLLADLGLERQARDVTPSLSDYIAGNAS
ncbi:MAG: hypothetical protein ACSHXW_11670 [Yoonia sp.]